MGISPLKIDLELTPSERLDVIDVNRSLVRKIGAGLSEFKKAVYYSYHTTAGYFEQSLCDRLNNDRDSVRAFVQGFQRLFPPDADYQHDCLHLRNELSEEQKKDEPLNGDSHLTYIGSGLAHCVTYRNQSTKPVFFVDLDGIYGETRRRRHTTVVTFNRHDTIVEKTMAIPVSAHPIDSVNLKDSRLGLFQEIEELAHKYEISSGRADIQLLPEERHAGLTVNEYETLLMKHDLVEVLRNPLRFMAEKGLHMLNDPRAIPGKALNYAKYDLVHVVNEFIDALGLSESLLEKIVDKFLAVPAERALRMKRSVSLLITPGEQDDLGSIVQGTFQSPVLVQWRRSEASCRRVAVRLVRFQ